jgi:P pilus assembly chaperone PapD
MGNDTKIDIRKGGTVNGSSFTWKNGNPNQTTADNFTPGYLTLTSYPVNGSSNGKDGEMGADVVTDANGTCNYNWGDQITGTTGNGTLHINNTSPRP